MKQLTQTEVSLVRGGSPYYALFPTLGMAAKGLALCREQGYNPISVLPSVGMVAFYSAVGAIEGYYTEKDVGLAGMIGGGFGMMLAMITGIDALHY